MPWGSTSKSKLLNLFIRVNNVIRGMTFQNKFCHITSAFKQLQILQIKEIFQLEPGNLCTRLIKGKSFIA